MKCEVRIEVINCDGTVKVVSPGDSVTVMEPSNVVEVESGILYRVPKNYGLISWNGSYLTVS